MTKQEQINHWKATSDPVEALKTLIEFWYFIGTDPYYREMNDALFEMAKNCAKQKDPSP